jgi:arabinose-5-phosphate isomerase
MKPQSKNKIIESAHRTLTLEAETLLKLAGSVDATFVEAVNAVLKSKGRLVVTGIGKSANIAQKLVATFNSTGQQALFMHAADAIHGDLGNVHKHDMVLCISKSGDSPEIKVLLPLLKSMGNKIIGMVSNKASFLATHSHIVLHTPVDIEACPNNLAPTCSTTAQLAMGDALAVALMESRGFTAKDFAKYHPGGALGKKLYVKMGDLLGTNSKPTVAPADKMKDVIIEISSKRLGATAVILKDKVVGIITDGDIRRMLEKNLNITTTKATDVMGKTPMTIDADALAVEGFQIMESKNITTLIVTKAGNYKGIVHLHDILKEGIY